MDINYLKDTIRKLECIYHEMDKKIEHPIFIDVGGYNSFRYENLSDSLACFLKGVKTISTLNATIVLFEKGYIQEVGALCRMIENFCDEIFFLLIPQDGENSSKKQIQFLEDFFQEEFDKPMDPLGSTQKRSTVPVREIHATCAKIMEPVLNSSDSQELRRTVHQILSGYVHGAYPHIMEMYGGNPPYFHLSGMIGTPRTEEWSSQMVGYGYRVIMVSVFVAHKLCLTDIEIKVKLLLKQYESDTNCKSDKTTSELLRNIKGPKA